MKKLVNKKGQHVVGLPFGIIFGIFMIILFVIIAFFAIRHFMDLGDCSRIGMFWDNTKDSGGFQYHINEAFSSQESSFKFKPDLPGIEKICFVDFSSEITNEEDFDKIKAYEGSGVNVVLSPPEKACDMQSKEIKHINITKITENRNPYCVDVARELTIKKGISDKDVVVE